MESTFLRLLLEPRLRGEAFPVLFGRTLDMIDQQEAQLWGGMNYHIEISFDDGISWLARIRRSNATSPLAELRDYILRSEVATLYFLSETQVPVPKVFDFAFCETIPVGVGYILMERLPGRSLR